MQKNKNAFTLVELIIVITILAVLATIAFVSFQGYSMQARDTKKVTEIKNFASKIEAGVSAQGISPASFVEPVAGNVPDMLSIMGSFYWWGTLPTTYKAGKINPVLLEIDSKKIDSSYKIGAISLRGRSFYQIVATNEKKTQIITEGNYIPRESRVFSGIVANGNNIQLASGIFGYLKQGDEINRTTAPFTAYEIIKISPDLSTLTLSGSPLPISTNYRFDAENNYLVNVMDIIPGFYGY